MVTVFAADAGLLNPFWILLGDFWDGFGIVLAAFRRDLRPKVGS